MSELDFLREDQKRLKERVVVLEDLLRDIRDNWDCDEDGHKYGTSCRCCQAAALIGPKEFGCISKP